MKEFWETCQITGKQSKTKRGFLNHLRTLNLTSKKYYDLFIKKEDEGVCYCGNATKYHGFAYKKYCSDICALKSKEHKEAVSQRFINNPLAYEHFCQSRKGVDSNIEKRRKTIEDKCFRLGISLEDYYSNHSKLAFSSLTLSQVRERTLKSMATKILKGNKGGRSGYKSYPFFDENVSLQGYEPIILNCLIYDFDLKKEQIICGKGKVPHIIYGERNIYFPDFFLPDFNLLIEVKSTYTYEQHKDIVHKKCKASIDNNYSIVLLVLTVHEVRNHKLEGVKNLLHWAISSQASKPIWYGEGSSTIPSGSREQANGSRNAVTLYESVI
jgi:hypothetical protein